MIGITSFFILFYGFLLNYIQSFWIEDEVVHNQQKPPFISVLIPIRNEEKNIRQCIDSILQNSYPKSRYEIIVLNDFSTDTSSSIVLNMGCPNLLLINCEDHISLAKNSSKKKAIQIGLEKCKGEIVLQTDGDTTVGKEWLSNHGSKHSDKKYTFLGGPIKIKHKNSLLTQFQSLDNMGMMAVTNAGIKSQKWYMANGANMSFRKQNFGTSKNGDDYSSGDDMFLIQRLAQDDKNQIQFILKNASMVETDAMNSFKSLVSQRTRWASKNAKYSDIYLNSLMIFIWSLNLYLLLIVFVNPFFSLVFIGIKAIFDVIYLRRLMPFFNEKIPLSRVYLLSIVHSIYIVVFGLVSLISPKYRWKSRLVH